MRRLTVLLVALAPALLSPATASAHPGHGTTPEGPAHYLTEPIHLFSLLAISVCISLAIVAGGAIKMHRGHQGEC